MLSQKIYTKVANASSSDIRASFVYTQGSNDRYTFGNIPDGFDETSNAYQSVLLNTGTDIFSQFTSAFSHLSWQHTSETTSQGTYTSCIELYPDSSLSKASKKAWINLQYQYITTGYNFTSNVPETFERQVIATMRLMTGSSQTCLLTRTVNTGKIPNNDAAEWGSANLNTNFNAGYFASLMAQISGNFCLNEELTIDDVADSTSITNYVNNKFYAIVPVSRDTSATNTGWKNSTQIYKFSNSSVKNWITYWLTQGEDWTNDADSDDDDTDNNETPNKGKQGEGYSTTAITGDFSLPNINMCASGMLQTYIVDADLLDNLAGVLWDETWIQSLPKLINDPIDAIISMKTVPVNVSAYSSESTNLIINGYDTNLSAPKLTTQYVKLDFGYRNINEFYGDFSDYSMVDAEIVLPYIGTFSLNIHDIMYCTLHLYYNIDLLTGECVAILESTKNEFNNTWTLIIGQYSGNIASEVPITSQKYGNMISSFANAATAVASKNVGAAFNAGLEIGMPERSIETVSGLRCNTGSLTYPVPFIKLQFPIRNFPKYTSGLQGNLYHAGVTLGQLQGQVECEAVHLSVAPATQEELNMIDSLLKSGIVI